MTLTRRAAVCLAAACAVLVASVPSSAVGAKHPKHQSSKRATFGIGPASATALDGRPYLSFGISPGATATDHVAVENLSGHKLRIQVYPVDTTEGAQGVLGFAPRAAHPHDAGSWISIGLPQHAQSVVLPPRTTRIYPVSVHVPSNAQPGDHAAGIIASVISHVVGSAGKQAFEQRVALRTFFRITGTLKPQLSVKGLHVFWSGTTNPFGTGTARVVYTVENTGNVRLGGRQHVTVSGLFGASTVTPAPLPLLLPGASDSQSVRVTGVFPQIAMTARVSITPLTVPGDADGPLPDSYQASTRFWAIPWTLLGLVLLVLIVVAALIVMWLRRRKRLAKGLGAKHAKRTSERTEQTPEQDREELPA